MLPKLFARSGASRRLVSVLALTLGACATYYDDPSQHSSGGASGTAGGDVGGSAGASSAAGLGGGGSSGGSVTAGKGGAADASGAGGLGGTGGAEAGTSNGGSAGGGNATGGAAGSGGSGGAGGNGGGGGKGGGGGSGGKGGGGGSGGNAIGGNAGSGGTGGMPRCTDHPLTAKSKWVVTASMSDGPAPPANAVDGDLGTRWSTGKEQMGGEWLQIDFGAVVSITQLTLALGSSINDYPRKYATRFSNSSQNTVAPVLVSGMGAASTDTVMNFPKGTSGRYVLISQSGVAPGLWWSVAEVLASCAD